MCKLNIDILRHILMLKFNDITDQMNEMSLFQQYLVSYLCKNYTEYYK